MSITELFITNFLFIWGLKFAFSPDQVFDLTKLRLALSKTKFYWLRKPLFDCAPCMSSIYGSLGFLIVYLNCDILWIYIFVWVPCLAGLSAIIIKLSTMRNL